jgi:hypothetical protein
MSESRSPISRLAMQWSQDRQMFRYDTQVFTNESATETAPSHDLAHILIAANGILPWCPVGPDSRLAEYNAVLIEHLLGETYCSIMLQPRTLTAVLNGALRHARWFVDEHYAPFPVSAEQAFSYFIDALIISRLSPLFFKLREGELKDVSYRQTGVTIQFDRDDAPDARGKVLDFSNAVRKLLQNVVMS